MTPPTRANMKTKNHLILTLLVIASPILVAQPLPDEINYPHYEEIKNEDAKVLASDTAKYNKTVSDRVATEQAISTNQSQTQQLLTSLSQAQNELSNRSKDQAALDQKIDRVESQLRNETNEYNREVNLLQNYERDYQHVLRVYQPINNRYETQKARLVQEEQHHRRFEQDVIQDAAELDLLERKLGNIPNEINQKKAEIEKLKAKITKLTQDSSSLSTKVTNLKNQISGDDAKVTTLKTEITELNKEIALLKRQIENARQNGTDPAEIKKMEDELAAKTKSRETKNTEKSTLETALAPLKAQLLTAEAELKIAQTGLNDAQRSLNAEENTLARLINEESQLLPLIQKAKQSLSRSSSNLRQAEQNLIIYRREFQIAEREWRDTVELVNLRKRELDNQVLRVNAIQQRKENLERELSQLITTSNQNIAAINSLNSQIQSNENSLSKLESELLTHNANLAQLQKEEATRLSRVNQSQKRFNESNAAFEKRITLFEKHEDAAIGLGISEVGNIATNAGDKEGLKLGAQAALSMGQEIGKDLGSVQGKLWANIRAEGQGYSIGYVNGRKSPVDLERAKLEGGQKGEAAANQYLEQVLRPKYFMQFLDELIEKAEVLTASESQVAGLASPIRTSSIQESTVEKNQKTQTNKDPQPLTPEELALSDKINSSLNALIAQGKIESKTLENKAKTFQNYTIAYEAPSKIPFGKTNCSPVYKELAVFKTACVNAYKEIFKRDFENVRKSSFAESYGENYNKHLLQKQVEHRANSYAAIFSTSYKLAENEGFKIGAEESFQEAVKEQYDLAYAETLRSGDISLRTKLTQEVKDYVQNNATLGLVSADLSQNIYMPGSLGKIKVTLKNVSPKSFSGSATMRITKVENIQVASNSSVLQSIEGLSKGLIPEIEYKISPNAKKGATLLIEGVVDLPGDKYRQVRSAKFQIKKVLGKNLVPELSFKMDETPRVRILFIHKKHTIKVSLSPKQEAVTNGYRVVLTPSAESASLIELKDKEAITKALNVGEKAEVKLSYKMPRAAKGKILTMTCDIYSEGTLIEQKLLRVNAK
jgi:hypothetical protein